jgi:bifunctional non-homologous end joining protein LigD
MGLKEYRKKRDFSKTPEPQGEVELRPAAGLRFVIQKHDATRLHYDLRLELDGVFKSWAVPKGPGETPGERHLAVHVEDHPLDYGDFEGVIPKGEYGGGTVLLWDRGTWEPLADPHRGYDKGELKFLLHGQKLSGKWTLVRLRPKEGEEDKNWLLIRGREGRFGQAAGGDQELSVATGRTMEQIAEQRDRVWHGDSGEEPAAGKIERTDPSTLHGALKTGMPQELSPQLATLVTEPPEGDEWLHEIKYDGYRLLCYIDKGSARLVSRRGQDWTERFGVIATQASRLSTEAVLDGEMVLLKPDGTTDFQALQNLVKSGAAGEPVYYVFDLPFLDGYDLTRVPLERRRELLEEVLPASGSIRFSEHIRGRGGEVFRNACRLGLEGIVSKRADSAYEQRRSDSWLKVKCVKRQEFVVGGYTEPRGSRSGFGALLVGLHEGGGLRYAGRVGTGFTERTLAALAGRLSDLESDAPPFSNPPSGREARGVHWVRPELVCEVEFTEWTREGVLRHPSFKGLREDKISAQVTKEQPRPLTGVAEAGGCGKASGRSQGGALRIGGVRVSSQDREVYPGEGITKGDIACFYESIAGRVLPYVAGRPLTVIRCPEGIGGQCFYQKHLYDNLPPTIQGVEVAEKGKEEIYLLIEDIGGLIGLVQMGVIELHPWGSRAERLEHPDTMVFDLDPDPSVGWPAVVEGAGMIRDRLEELGLRSFVKTTGGKGLHVVVPLQPMAGWEEVKAFAGALAAGLVRKHQKRFVATMSKAKRSGKIFIDHFRNSRGATSVSAYSLRARPGAPVSTPVTWDELQGVRPDTFTLRTLDARLGRNRNDPWAEYFELRQGITREMLAKAGA